MLYILSNRTNELQDLSKLQIPDMVLFVVFSNMPKNRSTISSYGKYCKANNIHFRICYIVGEDYKPTITCLNGIGSMYHKGNAFVL